MANEEHVYIPRQGIKVWNEWREEYPDIQPDLRGATLNFIDLSWIHNWKPNYAQPNLANVDFSDAHLSWANFCNANLSGANLSKANIGGANLFGVRLTNANLSETKLYNTDLSSAYLKGANFYQAKAKGTLFINVDLSDARGLETVEHHGPSSIGLDTIYRSHSNIPEAFLKGAGVDDTFITYIRSLVRKPIEYYSCFISYSSKNDDFAKRLYADLQSHNVRCWFAPEDLKIGDPFADLIEESIRVYDKLLVILSEHSIRSTWVEDEFRAAVEKENRFREEQGVSKTVLFPIKLDETIKQATSQWVCKIRRERHIGN